MGRVAHVDINSYFASLLQQENPQLRGRPVGVLKSEGRTCLITASKEAKTLGVKTGSSLGDAKKLVPDLIAVPVSFERCLDATRRLSRIFTQLAPTVDVFSLDEAFIDLSDCNTLYPDVQEFGKLVQQRIKDELGEHVTCNVGVSYTRLLAKLASEVSPKGSVVEITPETRDQFLAEATFDQVCGIGHRLGKRLRRLGVVHPYQINFIPLQELYRELGPQYAPEVLRIARGEDSLTLKRVDDRSEKPMQSVGRTITGYTLCDDEATIQRMLYNLTEEAGFKMRRMGQATRWIGVSLEGDGQSWWDHKTLPHAIHRTEDIFEVLYHELYKNNCVRNFKVIRFGVFLRLLSQLDQVPVPLEPQSWRSDKVTKAVDAVNEKYGLFTVRSGTLADPEWRVIRPEVTGYLGDKKYYGL